MTAFSDIRQLHIELTDRCQASCPMCMRNYFGIGTRPYIKEVDISLEKFKQWFPVEFLKNLTLFYACGSTGDSAIAKDCLEIFRYVRELNPTCCLMLYTNGSLRTTTWWQDLATVIGQRGAVVFAIDGFKQSHELYRKGTNWDKIIENARTFISAGGTAKADSIVFKHNEHEIEDLTQFLKDIGFSNTRVKTTNRFYGQDTFPVHNKEHLVEYYLEPPSKENWEPSINIDTAKQLVQPIFFKQYMETVTLDPMCLANKEIYVDAHGKVFPCSQVASVDMHDEIDPNIIEIKILKDKLNESMKELMYGIGIINLHETNIIDALKESQWGSKIFKYWNGEKNFACVKKCGKEFNRKPNES